MAFSNLTHVLALVSPQFANFTLANKTAFFVQKLQGFSNLSSDTQEALLTDFSYNTAQYLVGMVKAMASPYFNSLEGLMQLLGFYTTTAAPTAPPGCPYSKFSDAPVDNLSAPNLTTHFTLCLAIPIIVVLNFLTRRSGSLCPKCCGGRPGLAYPINFIDECSRRWTYIAGFGGISTTLLDLFTGNLYWRPPILDEQKFKFLGVFVTMVNVGEAVLIYYPLFACIAHRRHILANIMGILYSAVLLSIAMATYTALCPIWEFIGQGSDTEIGMYIELSMDIPVFISYIVCFFSFCWDFHVNIRQRGCHICAPPKKLKEGVREYVKYTRNLYNVIPEKAPKGFFKNLIFRLKRKVVYRKVSGLKYSPRVMCTMVVSFFVLYKWATLVTIDISVFFSWATGLLLASKPIVLKFANETEWFDPSLFDIVHGMVSLAHLLVFVACGLSFLVQISFMILTALNYRKHMRYLIAGRRDWSLRKRPSPVSITVSAVRFSGYQIAYTLWGFTLFAIIVFAALSALCFLIILPLRDGYTTFLIQAIINLWPTLIVSLAIFYLQVVLVKFLFLQKGGKKLALTNRHVFHVFVFFFFFYNVLVGLFSALRRILISTMVGTLFLSRLDKNIFMRDVESLDSGFKAYLGMLELEAAHTHPVMKTFLWVLKDSARRTRKQNELGVKAQLPTARGDEEDQVPEGDDKVYHEGDTALIVDRSFQRAAFRWQLLYTLLKNPTVTYDRLAKRRMKQMEDAREINKNRNTETASQVKGSMTELMSMARGLTQMAPAHPDNTRL